MKKRILYLLTIVSILGYTSSCQMSPGSRGIGGMEVELFGPLSKVTADINSFENKPLPKFGNEITIVQLLKDAKLNTTIFIPPTPPYNTDPFSLTIDDKYKSATFQSGKVKVTIINNFPFNIKEGAVIVVRNQSDNGLAFQFEISKDIEPNETYTDEIDISGVTISAYLNINIENIATDGTCVLFPFNCLPLHTFTADDFLSVLFEGIDPRLEKAVVPPGFKFSDGDTVPFNLEGEELPIRQMEGFINTNFTNSLPTSINYQVYFLDVNGNLLDSLLEGDNVDFVIPAPTVDDKGFVVDEQKTSLSIPISVEKYNRIKLAKFTYGRIITKNGSATSSSNYTITTENKLEAQLIADLKVVIR